MLGDESWRPVEERTKRRLVCEEWGNLGPMELDSTIKPNKAGFRVRITEIECPVGMNDIEEQDGIYYWKNTHD